MLWCCSGSHCAKGYRRWFCTFLFVWLWADMLQIAVGGPGNPLGSSSMGQQQQQEETKRSDILDSTTLELRLEKSNILMLGPTGSGQASAQTTLYLLKSPLLISHCPQLFHFAFLKNYYLGTGQNKAFHALPAARDSAFHTSTFPVL